MRRMTVSTCSDALRSLLPSFAVVKIKLPTGLALRILRCPAGFFGAARVLMAMRFHALVVTMAMISSASDEQVFYGERCPS